MCSRGVGHRKWGNNDDRTEDNSEVKENSSLMESTHWVGTKINEIKGKFLSKFRTPAVNSKFRKVEDRVHENNQRSLFNLKEWDSGN